MAGDKRKVQEINAGSMADIAFLLLIFFLVATTMNTDTGLTRVLPPMPDPNQKQEDVKVKERNLLLVFVSKGNNIMAGGQHGHCTHQEASFTTESHAGDNGHRHHRLELRQHEKRRPPCNSNGTQNRYDHQFPGLRLPALKNQEKGEHTLQQNQ